MTIEEIKSSMEAVKPVDIRTVKRYLRSLNIKPLGIRQRPQNYPDNTPALILSALGFETALLPARPLTHPKPFKKSFALVTSKQLHAAKGKAAR